MFRELAKLDPARRVPAPPDRIVERCLPPWPTTSPAGSTAAARPATIWFRSPASVWSIPSSRYDVDTGSDFISFAVPTIMGEIAPALPRQQLVG